MAPLKTAASTATVDASVSGKLHAAAQPELLECLRKVARRLARGEDRYATLSDQRRALETRAERLASSLHQLHHRIVGEEYHEANERASRARRGILPLNVTCGSGLIDNEEQCDDGNRDGGDGCSSSCTTRRRALI